jgi:hypothetical protein
LQKARDWSIDKLKKFKEVFQPLVAKAIETLGDGAVAAASGNGSPTGNI